VKRFFPGRGRSTSSTPETRKLGRFGAALNELLAHCRNIVDLESGAGRRAGDYS